MKFIAPILIWLLIIDFAAARGVAVEKNVGKPEATAVSRIDSLNQKAYNIFLTNPDSAHRLAADALVLSEQIKDGPGKGRSFFNLGIIYWSQSYYPLSLFYLKCAIADLPRSQASMLSRAYQALGRTYCDLKNYPLSLKYLDTAARYAGDDIARLAEIYGERAYTFDKTGDYIRAENNARLSLKLNKAVGDEGNTAVAYGRLATIFLNDGMYDKARAYDDTSFNIGKKIGNNRLLAYTYAEYAEIENGLNHYDKAKSYAHTGIALAGKLGLIDAETKAYEALVDACWLKRDYTGALHYQKIFNQVRDSLENDAKAKTVALVQNYYDLNARMNKAEISAINDSANREKIKSQHTMIRVLLASLVILTIILTATYYFYKQKQSLNIKLQQQHRALLDQKQLIEAQTANLQKVNELKDKLLAVMGHDLRSPIANLGNIIEMFDDGYLTAAEVHELMKDINPIIKGAELTLSNLVDWAGSQIKGRNVNTSTVDIFLLGVEMEQTFLHALQTKNIEFINEAYPGRGARADENHIKVILRNLISNAIKFTPGNGKISLTTTIENNNLIISIRDTGNGMSTEDMDKLFSLNTHFSSSGTSGEKGTGIGLLLCKELVELNGGKLSVKSMLGAGSTFYFNLPLSKAYA